MSDEWGKDSTATISDQLTGRKIASVASDPENRRITLAFQDGSRAVGITEGDCCSNSWIETLTVPTDIAGATVLFGRDSEGVEVEARPETDDDVVQAYHTAIATDRGEIIIEYRNSSNGYYGGDLRWNLYP